MFFWGSFLLFHAGKLWIVCWTISRKFANIKTLFILCSEKEREVNTLSFFTHFKEKIWLVLAGLLCVFLLVALLAGDLFALPAGSTPTLPSGLEGTATNAPGLTGTQTAFPATFAPTRTPAPTPTKTRPPASIITPTPTPTVTPTRAPAQGSPYQIMVNRAADGQIVRVYKKDAKGEYTVVYKEFICSTGRRLGDTPSGTFSIYEKHRWRPLNGGVYGQYASRFNGGILFHSVYYIKRSADTLSATAFNKLGQPDSDGCVRLMVKDVKWIYENCPIGTKVIVYDGPDESALRAKLKPAPLQAGADGKTWDPTDPAMPSVTSTPRPTPSPTVPAVTPAATPTKPAVTPSPTAGEPSLPAETPLAG